MRNLPNDKNDIIFRIRAIRSKTAAPRMHFHILNTIKSKNSCVNKIKKSKDTMKYKISAITSVG